MKISNQLNQFIAGDKDNFVNYKQFARLLVSENKNDILKLKKMNAIQQKRTAN